MNVPQCYLIRTLRFLWTSVYCAVRARLLFITCMIVWNASGVTTSSRNVAMHMPHTCRNTTKRTALSDSTQLHRQTATVFTRSAPAESYSMPRHGDTVTLPHDCTADYCKTFSERSFKWRGSAELQCPMKWWLIVCTQSSLFYASSWVIHRRQKRLNHPEECTQHSARGESLKSRTIFPARVSKPEVHPNEVKAHFTLFTCTVSKHWHSDVQAGGTYIYHCALKRSTWHVSQASYLCVSTRNTASNVSACTPKG
jgi:hypothetical protein